MAVQFDLIVRGGTIIDGTGAEPFEASAAYGAEASSSTAAFTR